jgi:hypothetical protein
MRSIWRFVVLLPLLLGGCPERKAPPARSATVVPEYERGSQAVRQQLPTSAGNPVNPAMKNLQRTLEASEQKQDRHLQRAEAAGKAE